MPRILTQAHVDQFRNRLCDVAARLYFEMGHNDFNMRDLASRVGVSAMTPYRYFGDKDGILSAVRARGLARLADQLEQSAPQGPAAVTQTYINFAMEEAAYYRLIFDLAQPLVPLAEMAHQERRVLSAMTDSIAAAQPGSQAEMLARNLWVALHGAICLTVAGKLSETELGDLVSELALMVLGINQRFVTPPLQASPAREAVKCESAPLRRGADANIAAE
ncbi:MAG TPA: TetR/AcrR family transcriptional regulator [Rhizomicrobium sp.]|nr:TetR/AcrR family transcriptional regulator [Rhizomicrobium sp.]